ncbi:MAG: sigma factor [Bacteroidota bacterium]
MSVINGIKEETLIQRLINGDQTAFELLFRFYYPGLVTFASQIVLDSKEAEEIVQDFFVKLWFGRREIKKAESLKSYFFTSVMSTLNALGIFVALLHFYAMGATILCFLLYGLFILQVKSCFLFNRKGENAYRKPFLLIGQVTQPTERLEMQQDAVIQLHPIHFYQGVYLTISHF